MNRPLLVSLLLLALAGCKTDDSTQQSTKWIPKQQPANTTPPVTDEDPSIPFNYLKGGEFAADSTLTIQVTGGYNTITITFQADIGEPTKLPLIYHSGYGKYKQATEIEASVRGLTKGSKQFSKRTEEKSINQNRTHFSITMDEEDFHSLSQGKDSLEFEIAFKYKLFSGEESKSNTPILARIRVPVEIQPIYESRAYFKSLKLNKLETLNTLGEGNDFGDDTPEACIYISSNNKTIIYQKSKNSFHVSKSRSQTFYHSIPNPYINIGAYDADYGLNFDDLLGDTLLTLNQLTTTSYQHIPLKCCDELLIYFTTKGQINK